MESLKLGFLGLGAIGFPMCYGLSKSYPMNLPTYRRERDQRAGFSPVAKDSAEKAVRIDEMLANGATACTSQKELIENSNVILISMPKSLQVEMLMNGPDGIIENSKPGTLVIDLTSADASSTRKLSRRLEEKGVDMLDACVSGGVAGAAKQTLTLMVGGKEETFQRALPILNTIGDPKHVIYVGPSGAGDVIKCANNFISFLDTIATAEALVVCEKAGISPQRACEIFAASGGKNDANMRKFPEKYFKGKPNNFAISLVCKDINLFNNAARDFGTPSFTGNLAYELWNAVMLQAGPQADMSELVKRMEAMTGVRLFGIEGEE